MVRLYGKTPYKIACHGMMIQAIAGGHLPKNREIVEFEMEK